MTGKVPIIIHLKPPYWGYRWESFLGNKVFSFTSLPCGSNTTSSIVFGLADAQVDNGFDPSGATTQLANKTNKSEDRFTHRGGSTARNK